MRIDDMLRDHQTFSAEIFPPKGELSCDMALEVAGELAASRPDYVSVTYSAGGTGNSQNTVRIASRIQDELGLTAMAHLTCLGATVQEIDSRASELRAAGIENVLALRGDRMPGREGGDFRYAADLISHLKDQGFCLGGACYPEGHVECEDYAKSMERLRAKQDAGVDFLVTQLFFDNEYFYRFREAASRARIKVPVVCGIMPFTSENQVKRMAFTCGATVPSRLIKRLVACGDDAEAQRAAGIEYACDQIRDLARAGVDGIHVYCMNRPDVGAAARETLVSCGFLKA